MGSKTSQPDPAAAQREESESLPCSKVKVLGRDMPGEPQQDSSWQRVSLVTAASVTKYSGAAQELDGRANPEKRTWERRSMAGIGTVADTVGVKLVEKLIDEICEGTKKEREAEATKPQESWMKEDFQELIQQMKAMREDLQKGQESSKCDIQLLIEGLKKELEKEREAEATKPQESWMKEDFQELIQQMKAMREDLQKGQESSKCDIQLLIEGLKKELEKEREAEATKPQESWMKEDFQELIQQMKAMREDLQKGQESSKCDIQLLIEGLKKELGKTEEGNPSKSQGSGMEETLVQLCKEMKAMREDLQKGQESTNCLIQLLVEDLNKEQGKTEKKNTPNPQGSGSEETLLQFCKQMKTMCEDLQKGQESTKQDIQLLRADLNKELDRKMKKMAKAQESKMDKKLQQLFQRILERELHGRQHILQLPRAEMEIEQAVPIESASEDEGTDTDAQTTPEQVNH
ncbi:neurofilament medium polypeptide-like [Pseudopipra pipra]|uniref:neurofilament medium polypeptide-like n=1 Tax=Pseudopipra pipra TaxID=415032 RepID=UPI00313943C4